MAQADTNFPKVRRMQFYGYILPISTLLHGHLALAFPSLPDRQILGHWGCAGEDHHLGKSFQAMDSGLECKHDVTRLH